MTTHLSLKGKCPICGSAARDLRFPSTLKESKARVDDYVGTNTGYSKYHDIFKCQKCHVSYMDPIDAGLGELCSQVVDEDYLASWEDRAFTFRDHLRFINKYVTQGKLLDVGCYAGIFLTEAKRAGFKVTGVEPSSWAASHAKKQVDCQVYEGMFDSTDITDGPFDIITIWDVIEHLANPKECLQKSLQLLKPGGLIAITTHDIESTFARLMGAKYPWLMRFHLVHFSPATLGTLLREVGFEVIETTKYKKPLSIQYFLKRFGIKTPSNFFTKQRIAFDTKDMFIIIAKKSL